MDSDNQFLKLIWVIKLINNTSILRNELLPILKMDSYTISDETRNRWFNLLHEPLTELDKLGKAEN